MVERLRKFENEKDMEGLNTNLPISLTHHIISNRNCFDFDDKDDTRTKRRISLDVKF